MPADRPERARLPKGEKSGPAAGPIRPRLFTYDQAASYLGLATKTLRNAMSSGRFPGLKIRRLAGKPLFDVRELDRFVDGLPEIDPAEEYRSPVHVKKRGTAIANLGSHRPGRGR